MNTLTIADSLNKYLDVKWALIITAVALAGYLIFNKLLNGKGDEYDIRGSNSDVGTPE